jgi:alpha-galactosidase
MAAPLIAGTDLHSMSPTTRAILTNREVIAVDQDPLGAQGTVILRSGNSEVLMKPLINGDRAVVLLNRSAPGMKITVSAQRLGLPPARQYAVRNLWTHTTYLSSGTISAVVPARSAVMVRVSVVGFP